MCVVLVCVVGIVVCVALLDMTRYGVGYGVGVCLLCIKISKLRRVCFVGFGVCRSILYIWAGLRWGFGWAYQMLCAELDSAYKPAWGLGLWHRGDILQSKRRTPARGGRSH